MHFILQSYGKILLKSKYGALWSLIGVSPSQIIWEYVSVSVNKMNSN